MGDPIICAIGSHLCVIRFVYFGRLANFTDEKVVMKSGGGSGVNEYVSEQFDATINWTDVEWLSKYVLVSFLWVNLCCAIS